MAIEFIKKQIIRSYSNGELKDYFSADYHNFNYHGKHTNSDKFDMQFINDLSFTLSSLISILKNKKNQFYYSYVEEIIQKNIKNYHKFEHYKYLKIGIIENNFNIYKTILPSISKADLKDYFVELRNDIQLKPVLLQFPYEGPIILSTSAASYFVHEIFGHYFESDNIQYSNKFFNIGSLVTNHNISIYDDPFFSNSLNFGSIDDSGNTYNKSCVVSNGTLSAYICSNRSSNIANTPVPRMTNTVLLNTNITDTIKYPYRYLYVDYAYQGYISYYNNSFTLFCSLAKEYINNKLIQTYSNVIVSGEIVNTIKQLVPCKNTPKVYSGICVKNGEPLVVGMSSPELLIKNVKVFSV